MVCLAQIMHLSCVKIRTTLKRTKMSFHLSLVTKEYHRVCLKWFSEPMVRLAQTTHIPCTDTNTIPKRTETWFHMTHVMLEFNRVRQKCFLSLWYVWLKSCTYVASRLALPQNGQKWASTWTFSPRSTIGCVWNNFWAYDTFGANRAPILHQH